MNLWHDFDKKRITRDEFIAVVEIPKGSKAKYELDKQTGMMILDRVLYTSMSYPQNYGFIPLTYCDDKDPLDVLILCQERLSPSTLVKCKPIGITHMVDNGEKDEKIIAVVSNDPMYKDYTDISELPDHISLEIEHFFKTYKSLKGNNVLVTGTDGINIAKKVIDESIDLYNKEFKK